jgi:hypothetical protein
MCSSVNYKRVINCYYTVCDFSTLILRRIHRIAKNHYKLRYVSFTVIGPCVVISSIYKNQLQHTFTKIIT